MMLHTYVCTYSTVIVHVIDVQELSVDKIKLDEVNNLAKRLISQDHSGSTEIQQSLDKLNARYVMYVRTYICTYVCTYICTYVCTYICTYVCTCTYAYVCTYVCKSLEFLISIQ